MPILSMFYGIVIRMYFFDDRRHGMPHVHAEYAGKQAVFNIENGDMLAGDLPSRKKTVWYKPGLKYIVKNCWRTGSWRSTEKIFSRSTH